MEPLHHTAALPRAVGHEAPTTCRCTAFGGWPVELPPHAAAHCWAALGQRASELILHSAALPWGSGH